VNLQSTSAQPGPSLVHVGRQPIFDAAGDVVAYELLFRGDLDAVEADRRDTYATSHVIINAFTELGIDEVVGDRTCFINLTREFLSGELALPFDPDQVVLEVLETVAVDDTVIEGVRALVAAGYRIALDDFVWGSGHERLLPLASYVKLDLLHGDLSHLDDIVAACRSYDGIEFVAEGIETGEQLALANRYGFELRQGYLLSRPQVLTAASFTPSKVRRLELLTALSSANADLDRILSIIAGDPALTMRVLRASNSAAVGVTSRVSSVRQAVVLIGFAHIRQWALLMVINDVAEATETQLVEALTRARLCESLAARFGVCPDAAFMTGLVTGVAELLGVTPAALAQHLPVTADISAALMRGTGPLGQLLRVITAYERGDITRVTEDYSGDDLTARVVEAMRWSATAVWSSRKTS
jgi:c-di-GMP-related signal transduction protein